jgi:hypothetical protein
MVMFGLATTRGVAYLSAVLIIPSSMRGPTLQAFATAAVPPHEQGALMVRGRSLCGFVGVAWLTDGPLPLRAAAWSQGSLGALESLCRIFGPIMFGVALRTTADWSVPGLPFVLTIGLNAIAAAACWGLPATYVRPPPPPKKMTQCTVCMPDAAWAFIDALDVRYCGDAWGIFALSAFVVHLHVRDAA